jgi:hypothetical protein
MPDDDRFSRYLSPAWRKVLRSLQGRDPAERVADDLAYHYGFDRMAQPLLSESYTPTELRAVMSKILADEQVSRLARRFLARPSGKGLRARPFLIEAPFLGPIFGLQPHDRSAT